ncbi:hypothetical protein [Gryllotalpicola ginsengisoli]|uniref:hypothetical protein n=1 Tax=Gryllotalpicola ginsengisoli TaxID=444608 RepID=UPI0003B4D5C5|nr:hypothetical protein [Gryllotalpicola ginsengisoli]
MADEIQDQDRRSERARIIADIEEADQVRANPARHDEEGPAGAHSAGDTLGGDRPPTGNDGTTGGDALSGDAGLNESDDVAPEGD